jgi:ORF6N domain
MEKDRLVIPIERVQQAIYLIRGQKVMLDKDLARLYGVETRVLNQAVRRNAERFPADFMFELTREEIMRMSQFVISSELKFSKNVFAFTQEGVAMLSGVLRSDCAVHVNIAIMRAFVRLREAMASSKEFARRLDELEKHIASHDENIRTLFQAIRQLMAPPGKAAKEDRLSDAGKAWSIWETIRIAKAILSVLCALA